MAAGFRKSFLGFNCDDVLGYIERTTRENGERELLNKEKIENLEQENGALKSQNVALNSELSECKAKLEKFEAEAAELKSLSEKIGKLYIVSKTNAMAIMDNANETGRNVFEQVSKNITAIENAQSELCGIRLSLEDEAKTFTDRMTELETSLLKVKNDVENSTANIDAANAKFTETVNG